MGNVFVVTAMALRSSDVSFWCRESEGASVKQGAVQEY